MNHKLESVQLSNVQVKGDLAVAIKNIEQLQNENVKLREENNSLSDMHKRHVQVFLISICLQLWSVSETGSFSHVFCEVNRTLCFYVFIIHRSR